jgi:ribonuclease P protein component
VDDLIRTDRIAAQTAAPESAPRAWLGCVVPKRHARRAVTRTLLKRQIRSAAAAVSLPSGLWVIRLRAGFDRAAFPSAASEALARAARAELDALLSHGSRAGHGAEMTAV